MSKSGFYVSNFCKSTFTLTFAIEVLGTEEWQVFKEEKTQLGPCVHGVKLQYQLYLGQSFDIDIAIWPNAAKIYCGQESCWVRVWQFLERRWLTFSIRHAFPVRVQEFRTFDVLVTPVNGLGALSSQAKSGKPSELIFPPLAFGERRYFARVIEDLHTEQQKFEQFITELIWSFIEDYIPKSYLDGKFNVPTAVTDIRCQDKILTHIQNITLRNPHSEEQAELPNNPLQRKESLKNTKYISTKDPKKKAGADAKSNFGIKISGDTVLAGAGRVVPFEPFGERPQDMGEIIILISSANLPAEDDLPIAFVNVGILADVPLEKLRKLSITHLYTRWKLGPEVHISKTIDIKSKKLTNTIDFNDHHCLPLQQNYIHKVTSQFLENYFQIELRGIRDNDPAKSVTLYGYDKRDREYGNDILPELHGEEDFIIAVTRIDSHALSRGINGLLSNEYPLFPPEQTVPELEREVFCTNDINMIRSSMKPDQIVPFSVILDAQMNLEISMGIVGCKPQRLTLCFSRLYFVLSHGDSAIAIVLKVDEINLMLLAKSPDKGELLTGFCLDAGDITFFYLEGPRDGYILKIWELTEEFYPRIKPVFSSSARYSSRIYDDFLKRVPFLVLKMHAPLNVLLACPAVYARPVLPLPARIAALKLGRLIQTSIRRAPVTSELPSVSELRSFRLELCAPTRTFPIFPTDEPQSQAAPNIKSIRDQSSKTIVWGR